MKKLIKRIFYEFIDIRNRLKIVKKYGITDQEFEEKMKQYKELKENIKNFFQQYKKNHENLD